MAAIITIFREISRKKQKGQIAILLTYLILVVVMLIAFGLAAIFVVELKNSNVVGQSTPAFYAADAGTEYALYKVHASQLDGPRSDTLSNSGAKFEATWTNSSVQSAGTYRNAVRKIDINW